jgi:Nitroreductase family
MNRRQIIVGSGVLAVTGTAAASFAMERMGTMAQYDSAAAAARAPLPEFPELRDLVRYATLAANGHNTQPWKFRASTSRIVVLPDFSRRTPAVDPDDHHLFVSLGCAAENLSLAAHAAGFPGQLRFDPANYGSVIFEFAQGPRHPSVMFDAIRHRQSTRTEYDGRPVSAADLQSLAAAAAVPGIELLLITDRLQINRIRDFVIAGNSMQMTDQAFTQELKAWLRYNPRQAIDSGDGLFSAASGNPVVPAWLGPHAFDWFFSAQAENDKYARHIHSSAGIAVFVSQRDDADHWVRAGQACQRFALQATALGLKHAFINQPVEVASLRPEIAALAGLPGRRPDIVMRFGYGPELPFSPRRPVNAVLE